MRDKGRNGKGTRIPESRLGGMSGVEGGSVWQTNQGFLKV